MSYNGLSTEEGGAVPHPDLASEAPDVSTDGLTWTFNIRSGIDYAPPFDNVEITAGRVVPPRVVSYSCDVSSAEPALNQLALEPGSS
jgi:hypothetical protein